MVNDGDADVECDGSEQALSMRNLLSGPLVPAPSSASMALSVDKWHELSISENM